jgi:hypothetical protein
MADEKQAGDLEAEIEVVQEQLKQVRDKLARLSPTPRAPESRPDSRPGVPKLNVEEIATNLAEVRDARRARQMTPPPEKKK